MPYLTDPVPTNNASALTAATSDPNWAQNLRQLAATNMPWPRQIDPTGRFGPMSQPVAPNDFGYLDDSSFLMNPPGGRVPTTGVNVPVGQVARTPQPGNANFWDMLRGLFSGQQGPSQGMTGLLARGRGAPGTNTLGNPFRRF